MSNTVSFYVSANSTLQAAKNLIKRELVSASNVKSQWTRQETQAALRQILRYLDELREIPEKGLIIFASSSDLEVIEPPLPNRHNIYKCGSEFYREPLNALYDDAAGEKMGLILIDDREATVAWFRGSSVVVLWHEYGQAMPKTHMGGMSQRRYQRQHDEAVKAWQREVSDIANELFMPLGIVKVLVAGPGWRKRALVEDGKLDYRLKVIGIVDAEYVDDVAGPREALARWKIANL